MEIIEKHIDLIYKLCSKYNIDKLYVFGSVTSPKFNLESDVDFIVEIGDKDPIQYTENYFNFKFEMEAILNRNIDLLEEKAIKNRTFKHLVNQERILIYDRQGERVA